MNVPSPDKFSIELLAAYADDELDASGRMLVERWLTDHPSAMDELRNQRALSPVNTNLWEAIEPLEPTSQNWATVRHEIDAELWPHQPESAPRPRNRRLVGWLLAGLTVSSAAAAIAWLGLIFPKQPALIANRPQTELAQKAKLVPEVAPEPRIAEEPADPLDTIAVLPIPSDDDVILDRVPEFGGGWLPVGRHPVPGILTLATVDELTLGEVCPSPAWPTGGGPKMITAPGDAPMIYAAKQR
jgi:hypothetical protein